MRTHLLKLILSKNKMFSTISITPILSDIFIVATMGHRIEPYVSIPTKLQTDSTGYNPRVSNSHWLLFPITNPSHCEGFL